MNEARTCYQVHVELPVGMQNFRRRYFDRFKNTCTPPPPRARPLAVARRLDYPRRCTGLLSEAAAHASRIHKEAVEAKEAERARIVVC